MPRAGLVPVAIFLPSFDPGGSEGQMIELARRLDHRRWQIHLACFNAKGAWFQRAAERAWSVAEFPVDGLWRADVLRQAGRFARWCRTQRIAVVHTGQCYPNIFGIPAAAVAGVPVRIGNRRNLNASKTRTLVAAERTAQRLAHRIVANSEAAAAQLRNEGVPVDRIAVIPNGIDVGAFPPAVHDRPLRRVIVVANFRRVKGHDLLITAAPHVLARFPDATFTLLGDGPLLEASRRLASTCGVTSAFTFAGHREDVHAQLAASDIFVLPSRSESTPNALLEAMASGLPVIASAVGGVIEIVDDGRTGLLSRPEDPVALAGRICQLMAAPALARSLAVAARASVSARYSFERMVVAFEELYERDLRRRAGRAPAA